MQARRQLLHMLSGVVIAVLLGIHMVIIHLDAILGFFGIKADKPLSWTSMMERSGQSIWVVLYIVLLAFLLFHALYGLRGILLEMTTSPGAERSITLGFLVFGIIAFIWGSYVPIALLGS